MAIRIVRLGSPRSADEGLRLGTVRRPPRGVAKDQLASRNFYDVWMPEVAPSEALRKAGRRSVSRGGGSLLRALLEERGAAIDSGQFSSISKPTKYREP